ncbi:toll-like receptor 7 [Heptranchias perlo]|uniref:toll-like receptor 7 n=1 Tax=Heptranchias perlo TaxID=212740 RepID=UPI00355A9675
MRARWDQISYLNVTEEDCIRCLRFTKEAVTEICQLTWPQLQPQSRARTALPVAVEVTVALRIRISSGLCWRHVQHLAVVVNSASVLLLHVLFLFTSVSNSTESRWFPRSLPCDVKKSGPAVLVDCSDRELSKVPTGFPSNATNITLTINHIPEVHSMAFSGLNNLIEIDLRCNCVPVRLGPKDRVCTKPLRVERGAFSSLPALRSLYLDGNQLNRIPQGLPRTLTSLSLEANNIFVLGKENLTELTNLEEIYLGQNCYYRNPCNTSYRIEEDAFYNLSRLTILSLKDNNLTHVPRRLPPSLKELFLYNNMIKRIHENDFTNLVELETLDLSGNCPRCYNAPFPCQPCPPPGHINIPANAFLTLSNLKILRLHSNALMAVPSSWFKNTSNLKILDLSQNFLLREIAAATFLKYLIKLEEIDLSFNYQLKLYPKYLNLSKYFSRLESLQSLTIRGYVFKDLKNQNLRPLLDLRYLKLLDLGTNFIKVADLQMFTKFQALEVINLSENKISPSSTDSYAGSCGTSGHFQGTSGFYGSLDQLHYFRYDEYGRSCKSKNPFFPVLKTECNSYGSTLDLSRNNIFFISPTQFKNLSFLRCLNLSGNAISQTLNGSEFQHLPHLQYLDLSNNRIDLLYESAFQELRELQVLDLSGNNHYFEMEGLTHSLGFMQNLTSLTKLIMNKNGIYSSADPILKSKSLNVLEFRGNRLDYMWKDGNDMYIKFFKDLCNLTRLDLSDNSLNFIPPGVFEHLPPTLKELLLSGNQLTSFNWGRLYLLASVEMLDLSSNRLTTVPRVLANCTSTLRKFILTRNKISHLTKYFLQDATFLRYLDLSYNKLSTIEPSSFPENALGQLEVLLLNGNHFLCTCDAVWFVWWINRTTVNIPRLATDVTCASPKAHRGQSVIFLDLHSCELDYVGVTLYSVTAASILLLLVISITGHLFFWDVWYSYHFCVAKLKGYRPIATDNTTYDAFVAYDTKDSLVTDWILEELITNLEEKGERRFCLCLEERDWVPGQLVMDNLSQSIHQSRKTIFVLTNCYVTTGNFRTAFYMAHQRLLDEKADVIILVFLEKALQHSKYLRLRKRLRRSSVLEWPCNPRAQPLFWQYLRNALATDNHMQYGKLFNEII